MKRIITVILSVGLLLMNCHAADAYTNAVSLLSELNIMQGDPDGNFRLDDNVSRAEFTKVAVAASTFKNSIAANLTISPFKDVDYTHWAAPYIKLAVSSGICKGYPDGSFNPDGAVLYEEAVTMLLKALGYTDKDFGISWPYGQLGLADNLEITKGVGRSAGDTLTRGDVALLVYNTLDTKMKGSQQKLLSVFDSQLIEDVTVIATGEEDSSVGDSKVLTSAGVYKYDSFNHDYVGAKGDLVVKNGDELVAFIPSQQESKTYQVTSVIGSDLVLNGSVLKLEDNLKIYYKSQTLNYKSAVNIAKEGDTFITFTGKNGLLDYALLLATHESAVPLDLNQLEKYVVYSRLEGAVVGYRDGTFHQIDIDDTTDAYKDQIKTTYMAIKNELSMGDILYVKMDGNTLDYVSYEKGNIDGPVTVLSGDWASAFALNDGTTVTRNGKKAERGDIQVNDVLYYSADLNMVLAYANSITGVYEKALPNKDMPSTAVISGVTYPIESVQAFDKLSSKGSFSYGDTITLLLGKTNEIADVISPGNAEVYGYLFETGKKELVKSDLTKYNENYVKIALPKGGAYEYIADRDYKDSKNSVVKLTIAGGEAKAAVLRAETGVSGTFSWADKKLGTAALSDDLEILDITSTDKLETGKYVTIFPQRLDGLKIPSTSVLYAGKDTQGKINSLILKNVTGDAYTYGLVTKADKNTKTVSYAVTLSSCSYTVDIGGTSKTIASAVIYNVYAGQPAKLVFNAQGGVDVMQSITRLERNLTEVSLLSAGDGENTYPVSDKVYVYQKNYDYSYTIMPIQDIVGSKEYQLTGYYDKPFAEGGRIRVILAEKK